MGEVIDIQTRRRIDHLHPVPSPDDLQRAQRDFLWRRLETVERQAEHYRRLLGLIAVERGVPSVLAPGENQLSIDDMGEQS